MKPPVIQCAASKSRAQPSILKLALALLLAAGFSAMATAQVFETRNGREISAQELAVRLQAVDIVLLGELHDNVQHHQLRGNLIAGFADKRRTVVAEHLPEGRVNFNGNTLVDLEASGFDPIGWGWPLHQKLFEQIRTHGLPLVGGNIQKEKARGIFLQGVTGLPERMAKTYESARLEGTAEKKLDIDLIDGHCGKLPDKYLPRMRFAQRISDLSMSHALLDHQPSILVAGNGHVRKDYGVPQVLAAIAPALRLASVGFVERGSDSQELIHSLSGQYDYVWLTERAERKYPCENFNLK